ncbi:MAG TPA: S46 family peptidase [Prolixibacteraceae bacterium]|nr:S46 family peptidase [Prolixibacteraceae bacterium]
MSRFLFFGAVIVLGFSRVAADEGMWLPALLSKVNVAEMQELGFALTPEDIYQVNQSSLKDAVLAIDRGSCTGELVSPDGLFLTNHHCGFGDIQRHSTEENNILKNGFWASNREAELSNPGKTVTFLIRMEDVTDTILSVLHPGMDESIRIDSIESLSVRLEFEAIKGTHYEAQVKSMMESNRFYLFVTETFRDIRLVGTPPEFIGKFGGDTDNWMWPRHTGDFSLFRIYTGPDGEPAEYAPENIPLKSRHFLPISLAGYKEGDFSMVLGYPGRTNRYLTSYGIKSMRETLNDVRINVRAKKLEIIREYMESGEKATIQYASKHNRSSNYYKFSIGQNRGIERLEVLQERRKLEAEFEVWTAENEQRTEKYGEALPLIRQALTQNEDDKAQRYLVEAFLQGPEIFTFAYRFSSLYRILKGRSNEVNKDTELNSLRMMAEKHFRDYDPVTDRKLVSALTRIYVENVDEDYHPKFIKEIKGRFRGDYEKWADHLMKNTQFKDSLTTLRFLDRPRLMALSNDPAFRLGRDLYALLNRVRTSSIDDEQKLDRGNRLFVAGLMEMNPNRSFYPDANSTLRLTYGSIGGYFPVDAVYYDYFTTHKGYLEKAIPGDIEFDVWPEMIQLLEEGDFGDYADSDGTLHTCFISNNDITGGNSGSPVMNSRGELIGIAFDGNWEAMSGDIAFEPRLQKCINVDIRFVLWIMDKFSGAKHLIDEMTILK